MVPGTVGLGGVTWVRGRGVGMLKRFGRQKDRLLINEHLGTIRGGAAKTGGEKVRPKDGGGGGT